MILVISAFVVCIAQQTKGASGGSPESVVSALYRQHERKQSPFFRTTNRALFDQYFDKKLADLIWKDLNTHRDEVGVLDFDVLYNAQDFDIKKLNVQKARIEGDTAEVPVSFTNFDKPEKITFLLTSRQGTWKISDIRYTDGTRLLVMFEDNQEHMFAGDYKVGETTCNVKPVKMAFEIRWARGKGVMMFFFENETPDGKYIYASGDEGAGQDRFIFDSNRFETGRFVRSDGKGFPVSKL
jgi:Protein of unknown function (DUF3828)